ncbi:hypothetical protein UlMin_014362 [Ulmus minor]
MVGFITEPTFEDVDQAPKLKNSSNPFENFDTRANDLSFADSFLDFDSINDWFEDTTDSNMADDEVKVKTEVIEEDYSKESNVQVDSFTEPIDGFAFVDSGSCCDGKAEEKDGEKSGNLGCCSIEEEIGKVCLGGEPERSVLDAENSMKSETRNVNEVKQEMESENDETESSESESSSSESESSGSSSSEDEEDDSDVEEKEEGAKVGRESNEVGDFEEGEIRDAPGNDMVGNSNDDNDDDDDDDDGDAMVAGSDADVEEDEEDGAGASKGPIRTKNEVEVLPPVPPVDATLQPHHQMLPVGVVLSILGTQVIVEGVEKHSPLNDGSVLWITETRSPLGLVDEIFGPVKHPYYIVRYNAESEVPAGIHAGTPISFVPDFANHVLNNRDVYKKGYDASGANDEPVSDEEEFSDDEKEAEYRKMRKNLKRGSNNQKVKKNKNTKNRNEPWKSGQRLGAGSFPANQNNLNSSQVSSSSAVGQGLVSMTGLVPFQQPQGAFFPNVFPSNSMAWLPPNQFPHQMPMPNQMPMPMPNQMPFPQQQIDPSQRFIPASVFSGEQSNVFGGSTYAQGLIGQNSFNQMAFGMGLQDQPFQPPFNAGEQGQPFQPPFNAGEQGILQNFNRTQSGGLPGSNEASQQFNMGGSSRGGRLYHRGRGRGHGRFTGGRGWKQSR